MGQIVGSVLMCHAPIVIPDIAGPNLAKIKQSTGAMTQAAKHLISWRPDVLVVLSPHTPRLPKEFGVLAGQSVAGDFSDFRAPEIKIELPIANAALDTLVSEAEALSLRLTKTEVDRLDHGAMVPLYFLEKEGWKGQTLVLSFPYEANPVDCQKMGAAIARAATRSEKENWAILASGDMSHRLIPDAPAGFHPQAAKFDQYVVEKVKEGKFKDAISGDATLRELAAEDVIDSLEIASAAVDFSSEGHQFISYEAPFGVGYLISVLYDAKQ